jgi:hypothetical protein
MYKYYFSLCLFLLFLPFSGIYAQEELAAIDENTTVIEKKNDPEFSKSTTIFQKISQDSFLEVILVTNFDSLLKNKKRSATSYSGTVEFKNQKDESFKMDIKVEPRGKFRRRICSMPPLKINFSKKDLATLGLFPGCDKLKLVTHCNDTEGSDQVLMKEFWSYKLYNQLSPQSFKVFPIKVIYVNSNNPKEKMERLGFFIENNDELAYRLNGELVSGFGYKPEQFQKESYHNTLLFQYMIGNVDWDIVFNRNVKFIKPKEDSLLILVPYDFDYSALVRAPYARLNPNLNQTSLDERFCLGKFSDKEALKQTINKFKAQRKAGFTCYKICSHLKKSNKKRMDRYLNSFFNMLKDKSKLNEVFLEGRS